MTLCLILYKRNWSWSCTNGPIKSLWLSSSWRAALGFTTVCMHGVCSYLHYWIQMFLIGHTQLVILDDTTSLTVPVISGVPQWLVLGPLYCLLFTVVIFQIHQPPSSLIVWWWLCISQNILHYNDSLLVQEILAT